MNKKSAVTLIIIMLLLSVLFALQLPKLRFNYVFEDFFPTDDPEINTYQEFVEIFEQDNDYLLIALKGKKGIFNEHYIHNLQQLTSRINAVDGVATTHSLLTVEQPIISPAGLFSVPLIHTDSMRLEQDSIRTYRQTNLQGSLISHDGLSSLIYLKHDKITSKEKADDFVAQIVHLVSNTDFDHYYIAGKLYAQGVFIDKIQQELVIFLSASVILVMLFLLVAYRSWWGVLIPLTIVGLGVAWIFGIMAVAGKQIDILMVLLPTIMFVVGMSDVVHLMTKYIENLRRRYNKSKAIKEAMKEVGLATFLTSLTTAIGFLTLMTASIGPIQEFGIYTAIGVFVAFIVTFTLLPASWVLLPTPKIATHAEQRAAWTGSLGRCFIYVLRKAPAVVVLALVVTGASALGLSQIIINTYLIEDLPQDDPLKESFTYFDQNFGGSRPFEVLVRVVPDSLNLYDEAIMGEIEKINVYLHTKHDVGSLVSPLTAVKAIMQAAHQGQPEYYRLPASTSENARIRRPLKRLTIKRDETGILYSQDLRTGRISGLIEDIGSNISLERNRRFNQFVKDSIDPSLLSAQLTGTSNLIDKNNLYLAENMLEGLGIAFGVVALIAGLLFRSMRMVLITLIPNVIPLMMVAGIMGLFGITLKLSTSIIFTIAFGIAVDDTIHFTSKLKLELAKGKSLLYALKRTYLSTGKAIIVTSLILSGGFLILILSSFGGTFYTGLLISLTLIFALVIDLTLLPALIILFYRKP